MPDKSHRDRVKKATKLTKRRDFLSWLLSGSFIISGIALAWGIVKFVYPVKSTSALPREAQLVALTNQLSEGKGKKVVYANKPVWVIHDRRGNYKALSAICTHLGCIAEWQEDKQIFFCPCHAGFFDDNGRVLSGPPPRPLPEYSLKIKDEKIYISGLKEGERLYGA